MHDSIPMGLGECCTLEFSERDSEAKSHTRCLSRCAFLEQSYEGGREEDQAERGVEL